MKENYIYIYQGKANTKGVGSGGGRQCGRDHTIRICGEEEPAYRRYETEYAERERQRQRQRDRERQRHKEVSLISKMQQLQITTNLYKRLQSHFI